MTLCQLCCWNTFQAPLRASRERLKPVHPILFVDIELLYGRFFRDFNPLTPFIGHRTCENRVPYSELS